MVDLIYVVTVPCKDNMQEQFDTYEEAVEFAKTMPDAYVEQIEVRYNDFMEIEETGKSEIVWKQSDREVDWEANTQDNTLDDIDSFWLDDYDEVEVNESACKTTKVITHPEDDEELLDESKNYTSFGGVNIGDTIRIIDMEGEPHYAGREGVVQHIDDIGQLHGTWGGLAVVTDHDKIEVIKKK